MKFYFIKSFWIVITIAVLLSSCGTTAYKENQGKAPVDKNTGFVYSYVDKQGTGLRAISAQDGTQLWDLPVGSARWTPYIFNNEIFAIVAATGFNTNCSIVAMNKDTKAIIWQQPVPDNANNCPTQINFGPSDLIVIWQNFYVQVLDQATGKILADHPLQLGTLDALSDDQSLYVYTNDNMVQAYRLPGGYLQWQQRTANAAPNMLEDDTGIYLGSYYMPGASIVKISKTDGHVLWQSPVSGTPSFIADHLLIAEDNKSTILRAIDTSTGQQVWKKTFNTLQNPFFSIPNDGTFMYIPNGPEHPDVPTSLAKVAIATGQVQWTTGFGNFSIYDATVLGSVIALSLYSIQQCGSLTCTINALSVVDAQTGNIYWMHDSSQSQKLVPQR